MSSVAIKPSHVALIVRSVDRSAGFLRELGYQVGSAETWEGEGTKEIYIERDRCNSLLLMEPATPGAYQRAMAKRGPGLHHLAVDVLSMDEFLQAIEGSGWLLHPRSVKTIVQVKTAYLARPGFPALIEVQEREKLSDQKPFVSRIELVFDANLTRLLPAVGLEGIVIPVRHEPLIKLGLRSIPLDHVLDPQCP